MRKGRNRETLSAKQALYEELIGLAMDSLAAPAASPVRASFCQMLAALREDQGRDEEAQDLLWRAAGIYRDLGRNVPQGECLCRLGFLFLKKHDLGRAASTLFRARLLLAGGDAPVFVARSGLGLAVCLAAVGEGGPARLFLEESRKVRETMEAEPEEVLRLDWLEGRIEAHLGDCETAVPRLESVHRRLVAAGRPAEAVLCAADLAGAYAKAGRGEDILRLLRGLPRPEES